MRHKRDTEQLDMDVITSAIKAQNEQNKEPAVSNGTQLKRVEWTTKGSRLPKHMHTPW